MKCSARVTLVLALLLAGGGVVLAQSEISITEKDFKKLDPFEAQSLGRADKAFVDKAYRQAVAEYDAFMLEFPRSAALPYALLRKGRALRHDNKRFDAIKVYNELLDYFPGIIPYAAPALYYMGDCHMANGNGEHALKCWKEMAEDVDYREHPLAAYALNALAGRLLADNELKGASKYYLQTATDFRTANWQAASAAIRQLHLIHVRIRPDAKKLRTMCKQLNGFDWPPRKEYADNDDYFWRKMCSLASYFGNFGGGEDAMRIAHYTYWADTLDGKFPEDDDFQKAVADFRLASDGDGDKWMDRLDKQFESYQKPDDFGRVIKWIKWYLQHPRKVDQYYTKLNFAKMDNALIIDLMMALFNVPKGHAMAKNVYSRLHFDKMNDDQKAGLARGLWDRGVLDIVVDLCNRMEDDDRGRMEQLCFWHHYRRYDGGKAAEKGVPLADQCAGVPNYAQDSYWMKAELLQNIGKLAEAIQAYQMSDKPPESLFRIADCLVGLGRIEPAVAQLREIENFFADHRAEAQLRIAYVYRGAGKQDRYVAELGGVMKKYSGSGQSSTAHNLLESMGIKVIRGGEDAD